MNSKYVLNIDDVEDVIAATHEPSWCCCLSVP